MHLLLVNEHTWNGNALNSKEEASYTIKEFGETFNLKQQEFSEALLVEQQLDTANFVERNYEIERFAKDIGLVYKKMENYLYCQDTLNCIPMDSVILGRFYEQKLIDYGKE